MHIAVFLCGVRWRHSRAPNSERILRSIFTNLRKDSVTNYVVIWTLFSLTVIGSDVLYKALSVSLLHRQVAPGF